LKRPAFKTNLSKDVSFMRVFSEEEINACRTPEGGFSRESFAKLGVNFPPKKGWFQALRNGEDPNNPPKIYRPIPPEILENRPDKEKAHKVLHTLVMYFINAGNAEMLHGCPDVIDYFGGRIPHESELPKNDPTPVCEFF
jgi:hypothetical protein